MKKQMQEFYFKEIGNSEFEIEFTGWSQCKSNEFFGPFIRPYYLFVYVQKGKGVFKTHNKTFYLNKGSTFVIFPNEITFYKADKSNPWFYYWLAVDGKSIAKIIEKMNITPDIPIFLSESIDKLNLKWGNLLNCCGDNSKEKYFKILSKVFSIFHEYTYENKFFDTNQKGFSSLYIDKAINLIIEKIPEGYNISELASEIGVSREYISRLIKKEFNISFVQLIFNYRMFLSRKILDTTSLNIQKIAELVGYHDPNYFSARFTKFHGINPSQYRDKRKIISE